MATATHKGTCQVCGAMQKLPGGRLSKHGYTTRFGFFEGVCSGAHGLPFEQSTDLIARAVKGAQQQAERITAEADALDTETGFVWISAHVKSTGKSRWFQVAREELTMTEVQYSFGPVTKITWQAPGARHVSEVGEYTRASVDEKIIAQNSRYASQLRSKVKQITDYIAWQEQRIANWAPAELTPV